jgi:hypothetical protein
MKIVHETASDTIRMIKNWSTSLLFRRNFNKRQTKQNMLYYLVLAIVVDCMENARSMAVSIILAVSSICFLLSVWK